MAKRKTDSSTNGKLTTRDRIAIALSQESSRELARKYGVHHSRICTIRAEAQEILRQEWDSRRPGRPQKPQPPEAVSELNQQLQATQRSYELSLMRNDWLNLQMKLMARHAAESGQEQLFNDLKKKAGTIPPVSKP